MKAAKDDRVRRSGMQNSKVVSSKGVLWQAPKDSIRRASWVGRNLRRLTPSLQPMSLDAIRRIVKSIRGRGARDVPAELIYDEVEAVFRAEWSRYVADYFDSVAVVLEPRLDGMEDAALRISLKLEGLTGARTDEGAGREEVAAAAGSPLPVPPPPEWREEILSLIHRIDAAEGAQPDIVLDFQIDFSALLTAAVIHTLRPWAGALHASATALLSPHLPSVRPNVTVA